MIKLLTKSALVATVLVATPALAQSVDGNPASADGTARVRILEPLSIDNAGGLLDFGLLVKSASTVAATNYGFSINADTGVFGACDAAWTCSQPKQRATFVVTGTADAGVQVSIPTAPVDLDGTPAADLSLALTLSGDGDADGDANVVLNTGTNSNQATFYVGGNLTVRGGTPTGVYTAPFTVSAEYL